MASEVDGEVDRSGGGGRTGVPADEPDGTAEDVELTLALPEWLNAMVERRRLMWTPVDTVAVLAIVLHLGLLAVLVGRGALYLDDLRAQAAAHGASLAANLFSPATGPFAPLPGVLEWVQADRYPLAHWPAVLVTLAVRGLLAVAFWRLLRRLLGPRPAVLLPLVLLLLSPALLPATTWYRPSITVLAATAGAVWALDAFVGWQLEGSRRALVTVVVATVLACSCHVVGLAVPLLLLAVQLVVLGGRRSGAGLRGAAPAIGLSALTAGVFLAGYLTRSGDRVGPAEAGSNPLVLLGNALFRNVMPTLLGGPYGWVYPRPYAGTADPDTTVVAFAGIAVLVALGLAVWQSIARTIRGLVLLALLAAVLSVVVGLGRADAVGPLFTRTDALAVALVPFVLLAAALIGTSWSVGTLADRPQARAGSAAERALRERARLAGVPMDDGRQQAGTEVAEPVEPEPVRTRRELRYQGTAVPVVEAGHGGLSAGGAGIEIGVPAIAAALVVVAIVVGSLASTVTYTRKWWDNPTGDWLARMQVYLVGAEAYPRIVATPLPAALFPAAESRIFPSSAPLLLMLRSDIRFHDADGQSRAMTDAGDLIQPLIATLAQSSHTGLCAATIPAGKTVSRWVRLTEDARYVPGAQVEVGVLVNESGRVEVKVRTPAGTVLTPTTFGGDELPAGPHTLHFPVPFGATVRSVQVTADARTTTTCVSGIRVWGPVT